MKEKTIKKQRTKTQEIIHNFVRNRGAMIGLFFIMALVVLALLSNVMFDYDVEVTGQNIKQRFIRPCLQHPFGTDNFGRDLFARCMYGARASLPIGFFSVVVGLIIGVIFGAFAGYYGGFIDNLSMRIMDIIHAIPNILLSIALVSVLGTSTKVLILAIGIGSVPSFARITRASVMTVRDQEFVESSKAIGLNAVEVIFQHVVPNSLSPIIVQASLRMGSAIIAASSLSYLGLGVNPPTPEWGSLLSAGRLYVRDYSYLTVFPGLMILFTVIAFNIVGDGLRDAMDPKLKK